MVSCFSPRKLLDEPNALWFSIFLFNRMFAGRERGSCVWEAWRGASRVSLGGCGTARLQLWAPGVKPGPPVLAIQQPAASSERKQSLSASQVRAHLRDPRGRCTSSGVVAGL